MGKLSSFLLIEDIIFKQGYKVFDLLPIRGGEDLGRLEFGWLVTAFTSSVW